MTASRPDGPATLAPTRPPPAAAASFPPLLVFEVAGHRCGIPIREVGEVVPLARLAQAPCQPSVLDGFLNLGGTAVAVVGLARLFGLPDRPPGLHTPLVVLRRAAPPVALRVDQVCGILRPGEGEVAPVSGDQSFHGCVEGVATAGGRPVLLLAPDLLLLDKERQVLAEFHDREQERLRKLGGAAS